MKKLFMFLAVAGLATFGASCSSDDSKGGDDQKQLSISSDAKNNTVAVGGTVTFTAKVGDKIETGATFYVDGTKANNPYKFDKEGEYEVIAKKDKFKDSAAIKIKVTKDGDPGAKKTLKLSVDKTTVKIGGEVKFTVKDGNNVVVEDAVIKKVGGAAVESTWTADAIGTAKFVASKTDYTDSNEVTVTVIDDVEYTLSIVGDPNNIVSGVGFDLLLQDNKGNKIEGATLYFNGGATDVVSNANGVFSIRITGPGGESTVYAEKNGIQSNDVVINVKPAPKPTGQGTVKFGTTTENIELEVFGIVDVFNEGGQDYAIWRTQVVTASYIVQHTFYAKTVLNANGQVTKLPATADILKTVGGFAIYNKEGGTYIEGMEVNQDTGAVSPSAEYLPNFTVTGQNPSGFFAGTDKTSAKTSVGKALVVNYTGEMDLVDMAEDGARGFAKKQVVVKKVNTSKKQVLTANNLKF